MPRFFIDETPKEDFFVIDGEDAHHISKVLRMKTGEQLVLCDSLGNDYISTVEDIQKNSVKCKILKTERSVGEADIDITLYMGLPKGDKMDFIIQKAVELGAKRIVPFLAKRSVSRPDEKSMAKKCERWRKIAKEAAMQSGRGIIPQVSEVLSFEKAVFDAIKSEKAIFLYENEKDLSIRSLLSSGDVNSVSLMVGPEGGFDKEEFETAVNNNMQSVSLGKRILRCETAPIVAISAVMYECGGF